MKKTIIAVKLRTSKAAKEGLQLVVILVGLGIAIGLLAAAQVYLCKLDHPGWGVRRCLTRGL